MKNIIRHNLALYLNIYCKIRMPFWRT